jgi:hypothetical protein
VSHLGGSGKALARLLWLVAETSTTLITAPIVRPRRPQHKPTRARPHDEYPLHCVSGCCTVRSDGACSFDGYAAGEGCMHHHPYLARRGCSLCSAHLPGTRRFSLEQGRSSQGDSLFWPSAMKRNLRRRPASDRGSKRWDLLVGGIGQGHRNSRTLTD